MAVKDSSDKSERSITIPIPAMPSKPPDVRDMAVYGGVATLAALAVIEWPVAAVAAATYALARHSRNGNSKR